MGRYHATAMPTLTPAPLPLPLRRLRALTAASLLAMVLLGLAWELWWAPLRPGGSWWALKVLPLTLALPGVLRLRMYTHRWLSLAVWLYFTEACVRAYSDAWPANALAAAQGALSLAVFVGCSLHVRWRLQSVAAQASAEATRSA